MTPVPPPVDLIPMQAVEVPACWSRVLEQLDPPEAYFGPEYLALRPRAHDTYYHAVLSSHFVGLAYTQRPASTTMVFALGLYPEWRGKGLGPTVRDAIIRHCFGHPEILKLESQVYSSNARSLGALHGKHSRLPLEGRQVATIVVSGRPIDRLLFGITRPDWQALCARETSD